MLIEVNVDSNFLKEIEIKGVEGERVTVGIEYPWLHVKCKKCKTFGHFAHTCTRIEKQVWIPCKSDHVQKDLPTQDRKVAVVKIATALRFIVKDQWTEVRFARRTPVSKPTVRES
jgi:hypothetical protein